MTSVSISNASEFVDFATRVNAGETDLDAVLTADIDMSTVTLTMVGTSTNLYAGTFNGNGHTIENLDGTYDLGGSSQFFLFWGNGTTATITNTRFSNIQITHTNVTNCPSADTWVMLVYNATVTNCEFDTIGFDNYPTQLYSNKWCEFHLTGYSTVSDCIVTNAKASGQNVALFASSNVSNVYASGTSFYNGGSGSPGGWTGAAMAVVWNRAITVSNVFANFDNVYGTAYNKNRIAARTHSGDQSATISNAYAADTFMVDSAVPTSQATTTGQNGLSVSSTIYSQKGFFDGTDGYLSWDFVNTWYWDTAENRPKLRAFVVQISTISELMGFARRVNNGETSLDGLLTNDIDASGVTWTPIDGYTGNFNGDGYTISHLGNVFISGSGTLKNTAFESITISLGSQVMLVRLETISNCRAKGITLTGNSYCCVFYATTVNNCVVIDSTITGGGTGGGSAFTTTYSATTYVNDSVGIRNTISTFALIMRINAQDMNYHVTNCYDSSGGSSTSDRNGMLVSSTLYENPDFWFNNEGGSLSQVYLNYDTNIWEWDTVASLPRLKRNSTVPVIKVWNGSGWIDGTPHVWNGTAWKQADKVWVHNGTEWKEQV